MGIYLNPGNGPFSEILGRTYVDKTGLIDYVNSTVNTPDRMTCFTRPRRFGKSFAAKMLCAYYDRSCDSRSLFEGLEISKCESFEKYLNKFDVIYIDMTWFTSNTRDIENILAEIQDAVIGELRQAYPDYVKPDEHILPNALAFISLETHEKFVFIIDEWDAIFREAKNDKLLQREYVGILRGLFKGGVATANTIAAAYITGILPIKKYGTQSAMTDFLEFTVIRPMKLAEYIGFTEDDVIELCDKYDMDLGEMRKWYDGYSFKRAKSVYNPNSVMKAIQNEEYGSYWPSSESYDSLKMYIEMNFDGLKDDIIKMLAGESVRVDTLSFQNDMVSMESRDDVLTLLVHLGYLAYDERTGKVRIPNLEISDAFKVAVKNSKGWGEVSMALRESDDLLEATINGDSDAVAQALEKIHETNFSILQYNNEASLSAAITIAYYTAKRHYEIVRELPTGKGFADLAFIPYKNTDMPAMIIELKCDRSADSAIRQIKEKRYAGRLKDYAGEVLLVGINYDRETKTHTCEIVVSD